MSGRQLLISMAKKRCLHMGAQASNIACSYIEKFNNTSDLGQLLRNNEIKNFQHNLQIIKRFKYNKRPSKSTQEYEGSDDEEDDLPQDKNLPIVSLRVNSLRVDLVLKATLNMARNKVETAFYESKIRVNGKKIFKKSEQMKIGDEIDLIRGPSPTNPKFLLVSRVQIIDARDETDNIRIKVTRNKSLVIENYNDAWQDVESYDNAM